MKGVPWTDKQISGAKQVLSKSTSVSEAAQALGVDVWNLTKALKRRGVDAKSLLRNDPTDTKVIRERVEKQAASKDIKALQKKLLEAETSLDFYSKLYEIPSIKVDPSRVKNGKRVATPVTMASDWHVGEVVTREETLGRNEYNLAIARKRAANFWDNVLWLRADAQRTQSCYDHILNLNGDLISGGIHPELTETNEAGLVSQVCEAAALVKPGIIELAKDARKLIVCCTHGNHGRFTDKSRIKTGWSNNLESLLYQYLKEGTKGLDNVEWIIPRAEGLALDVHGYRLQCQHGTQIRSQGGIGGILVPLTRWATRSASADYYLFGHFHQAECFGKVIVNGSLIGESAFSKWLGLEYREPEQVNFMIDERRGLRRFERVSVT